MRLARIQTHNFRNLANLNVELGRQVVVVGENRAGKSNLVTALRLVLDPTLPYADRRLTAADFWDGASSTNGDPMHDGEEIRVSVFIDELSTDQRMLAALSDGIVGNNPIVAQLTYKWAPDAAKNGAYRDGVYFGDGSDHRRVPRDLREEVFVAFTSALRDVESDIRSWRRSPLRALLTDVVEQVSTAELERLGSLLSDASAAIADIEGVAALAEAVETRLDLVAGNRSKLQPSLRTAPPSVDEVLRSLAVYLDGDRARPLSTASLGSLNLLYFTLLQLGFENRLNAKEFSHTLVISEEPEAHLHPHLQRTVLKALATPTASTSVLVTTHSPQLVSATDARNLLLLRRSKFGVEARRPSSAELDEREWNDMNRYLNATQADLVFATKALLVEGYAEEVLTPAFASARGWDLDKMGITVCAVHGTHFTAYARFCIALGIPFAVITDGDPTGSERAGVQRLNRLAEALKLSGTLEDNGLFVGDDTLELDLYMTEPGRSAMDAVLTELGPADTATRIADWHGRPSREQLMNEIRRAGGKGRFAQRLSSAEVEAPAAFAHALDYLEDVE